MMALTVRQLIDQLPDRDDPDAGRAFVLFEVAASGVFHYIDEDSVDLLRRGLPDSDSDQPVLVLGDGGEIEEVA